MPARPRPLPLFALALLLAVPGSAPAHVPGSGPDVDDWFDSLIAPDSGIPCCNRVDCREVPARQGAAGWEAWSDGGWFPIPQDKVVTDTTNPLEHAVLCWSPTLGITCFVPPPPGFRRHRSY
jgi:hypothetical protein